MSKISLYFDEDAEKKSIVQALRNSGIDIITTSEANNLENTDEEQLIWAKKQGRVIYTFNLEVFCRLHQNYRATNLPHAGIIVVEQQTYSIGQQFRYILNLVNTKSARKMQNKLVFLGLE